MTPCEHCAGTARDVYEAIEKYTPHPRRNIARCPCVCGIVWARAGRRDFSQTENGELFWRADIGIVTEWPGNKHDTDTTMKSTLELLREIHDKVVP